MNAFKDANGRTWTIKLTLDLLDQVQATTQIDLAPDDNDVSAITGLLFQSRKLGDVLWTCIAKQASSLAVTRADFLAAMDADALTKGWEAVVDSVVGFTHSKSPKLAEAMREAIQLQMRGMEMGVKSIINTIKSDSTDEALKAAVARIGDEMQSSIAAFGNSVTS